MLMIEQLLTLTYTEGLTRCNRLSWGAWQCCYPSSTSRLSVWYIVGEQSLYLLHLVLEAWMAHFPFLARLTDESRDVRFHK